MLTRKKMHAMYPLLVLISAQLIFINSVLGSNKVNVIEGTLDGNLLQSVCTVTWEHHGKKKDCNLTRNNPAPITFNLGVGQQDNATNDLCLGFQYSFWTAKGQLVSVGGRDKTRIRDKVFPDWWGRVRAWAIAPANGGKSKSTTTLKVAGLTAPVTAEESKIEKEVKADDAEVGGGASVYAYATGQIMVKTDGAIIVDIHTNLWTRGGVASIDSGEGLTLPASSGVSAGFTSTVTHTQDPAQDFYWEVTVEDSVLSGPGASNPGWTWTGEAWFLPEAYFPFGDDITFTLVEDAPFEVEGESICYDQTPPPIPTLTEWGLIIFGVVLLGFMCWALLRRRKVVTVGA